MSDVLEKIAAYKRLEVAARRRAPRSRRSRCG
jgi:hypothetical protein